MALAAILIGGLPTLRKGLTALRNFALNTNLLMTIAVMGALAIGFAMGLAGANTAKETADVALMHDDLRSLPEFIRLSRKTSAILKQNITFATVIKVVFFVLAVMNIASLWMAVVADFGAGLVIVLNGLRLLRGGQVASRSPRPIFIRFIDRPTRRNAETMLHLSLDQTAKTFGRAAKSKLSDPVATGESEDQLLAPIERLVDDLAALCGFGNAVTLVGETCLGDLKTRPDYVVSLRNALCGFVKIKAPGKGGDPRRYGEHDAKQWAKLQPRPNLV